MKDLPEFSFNRKLEIFDPAKALFLLNSGLFLVLEFVSIFQFQLTRICSISQTSFSCQLNKIKVKKLISILNSIINLFFFQFLSGVLLTVVNTVLHFATIYLARYLRVTSSQFLPNLASRPSLTHKDKQRKASVWSMQSE